MTLAVVLVEPPAPLQVSVYFVVEVSALVDWEPLVASEPDQPPDAVQEVALVELHVRVETAPGVTVEGFALRLTVGAAEEVEEEEESDDADDEDEDEDEEDDEDAEDDPAWEDDEEEDPLEEDDAEAADAADAPLEEDAADELDEAEGLWKMDCPLLQAASTQKPNEDSSARAPRRLNRGGR